MNYYVEIWRDNGKEDDTCIKRFQPKLSERTADRIARGVSINLNHDGYYVDVNETEETLPVGDFDT